ncbi:PAS domain-containing protein [Candidatus Parcubacteria bacterium]|nr:PAS domain-containing protein [Candidatus Parcubacteria bacterium]
MAKQEKDILNSEEYEKIIESTSDLIAVTKFNLKVNFLYLNSSYTKLLGYNCNKLLGKSGSDLIHMDDKKRLSSLLKKYIRVKAKKILTGEDLEASEKIEYRIKDKSGDWRNMECVVNLLGNKLLFVSRDVTDRKQVEKALKESEKKFRDVVLSSADWIWEIDATGKYAYASGRVEQILGYTPEELIGKTPFELMSKEEARRVGGIFQKIISDRKAIVDLENWNLTKKGALICLLTNAVPLIDSNGELVGYRGVDKDITERKQTEEKILDSAKEWSKTFDSMADGVSLHSPDLTIINANQSLCDMLDKTKEELIGKKCFSIFHDKNQPIAKCPMSVALKSKKEERVEIFEPKFDKWLSVYTSPIINKDGQVVKIIHVVRDITERKQAEEEVNKRNLELKKANRLMVGRELKMIELKKKVKELKANN